MCCGCACNICQSECVCSRHTDCEWGTSSPFTSHQFNVIVLSWALSASSMQFDKFDLRADDSHNKQATVPKNARVQISAWLCPAMFCLLFEIWWCFCVEMNSWDCNPRRDRLAFKLFCGPSKQFKRKFIKWRKTASANFTTNETKKPQSARHPFFKFFRQWVKIQLVTSSQSNWLQWNDE